MTLEDRLQGEWLCCVDDQRLEDAWFIDIRGRQCNFEGTIGTLLLAGGEATLDLGGGNRFVINREWLYGEDDDKSAHQADIPVLIESDRGSLQTGWMFRPALAILISPSTSAT